MANLYTPAPSGYFTLLDGDGQPIVGGFLKVYLAGLSTPAVTYADAAGLVPNTNPIEADGNGRVVMFLAPGAYDFEYQDDQHGVLFTVHDIQQVPSGAGVVDLPGTFGENVTAGQGVYLSDGQGGRTAGQWYLWDADVTYMSVTPQIGFAVTTVTAGGTGAVRQGGQITGLVGLVPGRTYYVSTVAGALTDVQPANTRLVGVADSSTSLVMTGGGPRLGVGAAVSTITTTGAAGAVALPIGVGNLVIVCNNATQLNIHGIQPGADGQLLTIVSKGAGLVVLENQSALDAPQHRLINNVTGPRLLSAGSGTAEYIYDVIEQRWRNVTHTQGAWFQVPYVATNYKGTGAMVWDVEAADVKMHRLYLQGRSLSIQLTLNTTTISGTPANFVEVILGAGYITAGEFSGIYALYTPSSGFVGAARWVTFGAGFGAVDFLADVSGGTNFPLGTNDMYLWFNGSIEVQ